MALGSKPPSLPNDRQFYYGDIDDLRIYNRALTPDEIDTLAGNPCNDIHISLTATSCNSYTSPGGKTWTSTGNYSDTIVTSGGCNTIYDISLYFVPLNMAVFTHNYMLWSNTTGAVYQWLNCNNGYAVIPGETQQFFKPALNGSYAVSVSSGNCIDTSACQTITCVGMEELQNNLVQSWSPNPTSGLVNISLGKPVNNVTLSITNHLGQLIHTQRFGNTYRIEAFIEGAPAFTY